MAQHDMNIANQGFPATRADLNNALQALVSNSSGTSAPSTTFANQWWYDTTNNKMYLRNEANNAWIEVFTLDQTNNEWQIVTGQISAADGDGIAFKTDDGTTRVTLDDSGDFGIGTSSPTAVSGTTTLEIQGTSGNAGAEVIIGSNDTTATAGDLFGGLAFKSIDSNGTPPHYSGIQARANDTFGGANLNFYAGRGNYESNDPRFVIEGPQSVSGEALRILSGGGITFNGDTASSNALDDYEEGSWTPALNTGFPGSPTPTINKATYRKIGQMVHVTCFINAANDGTGLQIGGLPFTTAGGHVSAPIIGHESHTVSFERQDPGTSYFNFNVSGTNTNLQEYYISLTYTA